MLVPLFALVSLGLGSQGPSFSVQADERRHEVVLRLGPFPLPANEPEHRHEGDEPSMDMMAHAHGPSLPAYRFRWPVAGWARGFRVEIQDPAGHPLSRRLLHHVNLDHLGRRALAFPMFEKTMAAGQETDAVMLPKSVGVRIEKGDDMALASMWTNETEPDLPAVVMIIRIKYLPDNTVPRPVDVRPLTMDIGFRPGLTASFDLDTGKQELRREFVFPVDGRLLGLGGHLHDYGQWIELRDGKSGKVLVTLKGKQAKDGKLLGVTRKLLGVSGNGLRIRAGYPYLVVASYHNPTGRRLKLGGMAALGGIFTADDPGKWPPLDRTDPIYLAEMDALGEAGWVVVPESGTTPPPAKRN